MQPPLWGIRQKKFAVQAFRRYIECRIKRLLPPELPPYLITEAPSRRQNQIVRPPYLPVLEVTESAELLAHEIVSSGVIPRRAVRDAAHIAVAAVHRIDYLLTWNCRHLANAQIMRRIQEMCDALSERMPVICTPEELMGD